MKRAAIYARFSDENQRDASIDDQIRRCTAYAEAHQLQVVATFSDRADKGWNPNRIGYQALLSAATRSEFDVIVVDELNRAFRDSVEQTLTLRRLAYLGVKLVAVADGFDSGTKGSRLLAGIKGILNEEALEAIATETHRGLEGRIREGLSAGGRVFGYSTEAVSSGGRVIGHRHVIVPHEAAVVARIYEEYAQGASPADIADGLNRDAIPGPRGGKWSRNAIYGDRRDLSGILNNPIYLGELVWNRGKWLRDPQAGKRIKQRNPESEWQRTAVPELRIVSDDIAVRVAGRMQRVAAKGAAIRQGLSDRARQGADGKYMLTGLLTCAECGGPVSSTSKTHFGCSVRHNRGQYACKNAVKFRRVDAESAVIAAVKEELFGPDTVGKLFEALEQEVAAHKKAGAVQLGILKQKLEETERGILNCLRFIESGAPSPSVVQRLSTLEQEAETQRTAVAKESELSNLQEVDMRALRHFAMEALDNLPAALGEKPKEAREVLSALLKSAVVRPTEDKRFVEIELTGDLSGLVSISAAPRGRGGELVNVVAGTGFEPVTFGL